MKFVNTQRIKNLNTYWLDKNIGQNVKNESFWASCISGTLKLDVSMLGSMYILIH